MRESCALSYRTLLAAYLIHLLVPLILAVDSARAWLAGEAGDCEKTVAVAGTAWVLVALVALGASDDRRRFLKRLSGPLVSVYTLFVTLALLEAGLRLKTHLLDHTLLAYKPGTKMVFNIPSAPTFGLSPRVTFSVNALGLRGPMPPPGGSVYRIIAVGGSTTECAALDDSEQWPQLLMQSLNSLEKQRPVWVGNAGVSGLTTVDHLWCLRKRPLLTEADLLIFLIGANDLEAALEFGGKPTERVLDERAGDFIGHAPPGLGVVGGVFRRSWLFDTVRRAILNLKPSSKRPAASVNEPVFQEEARLRAAGPVLPAPDLGLNLNEYGQRVRRLERECRQRGLRCVFLTQPGLWRPDLSAVDQRLLWLGHVGRRGKLLGYAPVADLARALESFNRVLLNVCEEDHLECYDLASAIPRDTSAFYDDFHFNISGARLVADYLTERILAARPFTPEKVQAP